VNWLVEANISEKNAVSTFSPENGESTLLQKLASTSQSTQQFNPKEHQKCHHHENIKSHIVNL
jgi:hypothetical protein